MTDKEYYLTFHGYELGSEEAEEAWRKKCEMMQRVTTCHHLVMPDIQPYQTVATDIATGKPVVINSRSEHRAFLKRNGYEELGNDKPKFKEVEMSSPRDHLKYLFYK